MLVSKKNFNNIKVHTQYSICEGAIKIDDLKDLHVQSVPTDSLIADDFTINSFSAQGLSPQYDRAGSKQVPFLLGSRGPLSIRGRKMGSTGEPPIVKPGDKKS